MIQVSAIFVNILQCIFNELTNLWDTFWNTLSQLNELVATFIYATFPNHQSFTPQFWVILLAAGSYFGLFGDVVRQDSGESEQQPVRSSKKCNQNSVKMSQGLKKTWWIVSRRLNSSEPKRKSKTQLFVRQSKTRKMKFTQAFSREMRKVTRTGIVRLIPFHHFWKD